MSWFKKENATPEKVAQINDASRKLRTEGLWLKCEGCRQIIWKKDLESNWNVCPKCGAHTRMDAAARLKLLFDGDYERFDTELALVGPPGFLRLEALSRAPGRDARGHLAFRRADLGGGRPWPGGR